MEALFIPQREQIFKVGNVYKKQHHWFHMQAHTIPLLQYNNLRYAQNN